MQVLAHGRRKRTYPADDYRTPFEKLKSLSNWEDHLKPNITSQMLEAASQKMSDTESAMRMQAAKTALVAKCRSPK